MIDNAAHKIPWHQLVYEGVYLFEIKNDGRFTDFSSWTDNFKLLWENEEYRQKFTPNTKKGRISRHLGLNEWIPIYIGKSRNIGHRIHGHIYTELHKTTFALKLMARTNLKNQTFRIKTIKISVQNYDSIVPKVEWQLRNRINPIIGKQ